MNYWALFGLFIPVYCIGHGFGMLHARYIISRWPERNGFKPTPQEAPSEYRRTFTIPDGHEAVRDANGRATGETRPIAPSEVTEEIRVPLHSLQADVDYLFGRVAADGSCASVMAASVKERLSQVETALTAALKGDRS